MPESLFGPTFLIKSTAAPCNFPQITSSVIFSAFWSKGCDDIFPHMFQFPSCCVSPLDWPIYCNRFPWPAHFFPWLHCKPELSAIFKILIIPHYLRQNCSFSPYKPVSQTGLVKHVWTSQHAQWVLFRQHKCCENGAHFKHILHRLLTTIISASSAEKWQNLLLFFLTLSAA